MADDNANNNGQGTPLPKDLQAEADALMAEASQPDAPQPGTPGAPAPADDRSKVDTGQVMTELLHITFNGLVAPKRGDHWKMSHDESKALGYAYAAVIDKYFPNLDLGVELTAIVVTVTVIGPRLGRDQELAQSKRPASTAGDDTPAPEPPADPPPGDAVFQVAGEGAADE